VDVERPHVSSAVPRRWLRKLYFTLSTAKLKTAEIRVTWHRSVATFLFILNQWSIK